MNYPTDFMTMLAEERNLTPDQAKVFTKMFGTNLSREEVTQELLVSDSALKSRLTEIYKNFLISGGGPVKQRKLNDYIATRYQQWSGRVEPDPPSPKIETLVTQIRAQVQEDIQKRCGTMRVLDMEQPIESGSIYTDVNILKSLTANQRRGLKELLEELQLEEFDRFYVGQVLQRRIPGLEAVQQFKQLMILGKPGAGKTTFLKRLAMLCKQGEFYPDRIPVFVTLKEFAESAKDPKLVKYIQNQWRECGVKDPEYIESLLKAGRLLVLLDGLDEVQPRDHDQVIWEVRDFVRRYDQDPCVMTCRIAAKEYVFESFTEVEMADFDDEQIQDFVRKWFGVKQDPIKAEGCLQKFKEQDPIRELATSPLLLTLLCLVFGNQGDFPASRQELYAEGVQVLLKKWDASRNIARAVIYQKLSPKRKEELLSYLAFTTFEQGDYFFKQARAEDLIAVYIRNLPGASSDPEALQVDSTAVLKSIESQHGFLVERAKGIYSFSHLTFHEYFAARYIVEQRDPDYLNKLVSHINEKRWREIFFLTIEMLQNADELIQLMKQTIDSDLGGGGYLTWLLNKSSVVLSPYKPAAVRAFYFSLARARDLDLDLDLALALDLALDLDLALALKKAKDPALISDLETLQNQLPSTEDKEHFKQWWEANQTEWIQQLRSIMIKHRNIGHDWQFTAEEEDKLNRYYQANLLLVQCLNSECYVTREVRQEIEDTLLLPPEEIAKYKAAKRQDPHPNGSGSLGGEAGEKDP